jgi:hypothetical protein
MLSKLWRTMTTDEKSPYVTQSDLFQQLEQQGTSIPPWEVLHAIQALPRCQTIRNVKRDQVLSQPNATIAQSSHTIIHPLVAELKEMDNDIVIAIAEQATKKAACEADAANRPRDKAACNKRYKSSYGSRFVVEEEQTMNNEEGLWSEMSGGDDGRVEAKTGADNDFEMEDAKPMDLGQNVQNMGGGRTQNADKRD